MTFNKKFHAIALTAKYRLVVLYLSDYTPCFGGLTVMSGFERFFCPATAFTAET